MPDQDVRLEPALARFKAAVIANGLTEAHFRPPVPRERVQSVFNEVGLPLHPDIATLYDWSDGYDNTLGPPYRFLPSWHPDGLAASNESREGMSQVFDINPAEADLWPVFTIDYAHLCVHTTDGSLWEVPTEEAGQQVKPPIYLADLFNFWAHLHETGYYELTETGGGWYDAYDRGEREYGNESYTLHAYR